jgi:hypothetical protein
MMWGMKRISSGAWFYCMRSGIRTNLDSAIWEQGRLVDPDWSDTLAGGNFGLLGSRDADIARRIKQNTSDLQPHPKLAETNLPDEDVFFD